MNSDRRHPRHVREAAYDRNGGRAGRGERGDGGSNQRGGARQVDNPSSQGRERNEPGMGWKRMDLHLHTPASSDYRDPGITYLDILKKAEEKKLDMIAFADHNTVAGYAAMHREIEILSELERRNRLTEEERTTLAEYQRLLAKIVVLPAFEFTATFGFHILGIFPEKTSVRKLEYLLLDLNVPEEKMLAGAPDAGSTSDVLRAYQAITSAGGMAIAAHANSSNGVAMQGFPFGGQTKIAYTQDPNLIALEVTDLEAGGRRTTSSFFNGSKPEYPRRMHLIQGSDAHSLETEQLDSANKRLGVGARITEFYAKEASFAALKEILSGDDFGRVRPARSASAWEEIDKARLEGPTLTQSFHERASTKTSRTRPVLHDVVAFANTEGGTVYLGANSEPHIPIHGVEHVNETLRMLKEDIERAVDPPVDVEYDVRESGDRAVIIVKVPAGEATPYVYEATGQIYVRQGSESVLAGRPEIVSLVLRSSAPESLEAPAKEASRAAGQISAPAERERAGGRERRPASADLASTPAVPAPLSPPDNTRGERSAQPARREGEDTRQPWSGRQQSQRPAAEPTYRPPAFTNLPPEKIKGKVQPMAPRGLPAPVADTGRLSPSEAGETDVESRGRIPGAPRPEQATAPLSAESLDEIVESTAAQPAPAGSARSVEKIEAAQAETPAVRIPEPEEQIPAKPARGGSRRSRKAHEAPKEVSKKAPQEVTAEMQATVAAEHIGREEIVAEEKPPRSRKGRTTRQTKQLEIEAPAASAAVTEPGAEAVIEERQQETQVIEEHAREAAAPAPTSRSRRKKKGESQPAEPEQPAPVAAAEAPPAVEDQQATPAKKPRRSRSKKASEAVEAEEPARQAAKAETPVTSDATVPEPPTMGAEIIDAQTRDGTTYYTIRNLRDHTTVHNVTRRSARKLWYYAITQQEHGLPAISEVLWHSTLPIGLWRRDQRAGAERCDLVLRNPDGTMRIFYGVTDDGLEGPWREVVAMAEEAGYYGPDAAE